MRHARMKRSIHDQIAANKRASVVYATMLVLLLALLGAALAGIYSPSIWWAGGLLAGGIGLLVAWIGASKGPEIVLSISHARNATPFELQRVNNVVEEMAIAAGIPKPKVYIIDDSAPNAFATGRDPKSGVVCVTTGLIDKLNREELQGVVAHEVGHIRNYDIRFMTTLAIVAGLIPLLADMIRVAAWSGGGRRSNSKDGAQAIWMVVGLLAAILAPIFAVLLQMAVSRKRELLADATAAELTRNPEGLMNALAKISADIEPLEAANRATQHLYIVNPLKAVDSSSGSLFDTHPPIRARIEALRGLMGIFGAPRRHIAGDFSDMPPIPDPTN